MTREYFAGEYFWKVFVFIARPWSAKSEIEKDEYEERHKMPGT